MRNRTIVIGLLLVLCATALVTAQQNAETLFRLGSGKEQIGDCDGAIPLYERIVRESKDRELIARAKLHLGACWLKKKEADQAKGLAYLNDVVDNYKQLTVLVNEANRIKSLLPPATAPGAPLEIKTPFTEDVFSFAISPNGRSLVLQATAADGKKQLWLQALDADRKLSPIAGTGGAGQNSLPFFSPDGNSIGFFADGKLKRVSVKGGIPQSLAVGTTFRGGTWNKNDVIVFGTEASVLYSIRADGSGQKAVTTRAGSSQVFPKFLPDGNRFLFITGYAARAILSLGSLDNVSQSEVQSINAQAATFVSPDKLLYVFGGALMAQGLDLLKGEKRGDPVLLTSRVGINLTWPGIAALSASEAGPVAYRADAAALRLFRIVDRTGQPIRDVGIPGSDSPSSVRISPGGRYVTFHRSSGHPAIGSMWVKEISSVIPPRRISQAANSAVWSPNTDHLALGGFAAGSSTMDLFDRTSLRETEGRHLGRPAAVVKVNDWSKKDFLLYERFSTTTDSLSDLMAQSNNGGEPVVVADTPFRERNGRFSPDGSWVAYQSDELGARDEVFIQPFPGSINSRKRISLNGGSLPHWSQDGLQLYFLSADNQLTVVAVPRSANGEDIAPGQPSPLFSLDPGSEFEVIDNGKSFFINTRIEAAPSIIVMSNWADKLPAVSSNSTSSPLVTTPVSSRPTGYGGQTEIVVYDREGRIVGTVKDTGPSPRLSLSPDGSRVAYVRNGDIWVCEIATGASDRIVSNIVTGPPPSWSPDGSRIAYLANRNGAQGLYVKASNGTRNEELLYAPVSNIFNWSKDGRFLAITTGTNFAVLPIDGDRKPISIVSTNGKQGMRLAPDSHLVAYVSSQSGRNEIWVLSFDPSAAAGLGATVAKKVSAQGSPGLMRWNANGKELYYLASDGGVMAVSDARAPAFDEKSSSLIFQVPDNFPLSGTPGIYADISADGQRFVFALPVPAAAER